MKLATCHKLSRFRSTKAEIAHNLRRLGGGVVVQLVALFVGERRECGIRTWFGNVVPFESGSAARRE